MKRSFAAAAASVLVVFVGGCSGDKGGGRRPSGSVEETLIRLGVDITETPRLDANGQPVPDDYSISGPTTIVEAIHELMVVGPQLEDPDAPATFLPGRVAWIAEDTGQTEILHSPAADPAWVGTALAPWAFPQTGRAVLSANVRGDGIEETVVAYAATNPMTNDGEVHLSIFEDGVAATPFSEISFLLHSQTEAIEDLRGVAYDADGDGDDDLALALSDGDLAFKILFVENDGGVLTVNEDATLAIAPLDPLVSHLSTAIVAAQLDPDGGMELALTLMEYTATFGIDPNRPESEAGVSRYLILDDASNGFQGLASDYITAYGQGQLWSAVAADLAAGDIDADGLDEIVIGGPVAYVTACMSTSGSVQIALDDGLRAFNRIGEGYQLETWSTPCPPEPLPEPHARRWTHVSLFDVDADAVPEVFVGRRVFEDWQEAEPFTTLYSLPDTAVSTPTGAVDRHVVTIASGDFTGDGYEELAIYASGRNKVAYWGRSGTNFVETSFHPANVAEDVVLLPVNLDDDSGVLTWTRAHKLVFSEPIVLAALAAPPCFEGIGQNLDACVTTYGTAETETTDKSLVLSVTQNAVVGLSFNGGVSQTAASFKVQMSRKLSYIQNWGYTLSKSIVYTTGSQEDSVIFITIPYDQYTYIVSSHPDPTMVGAEVVVSVPREMVTLLAERSFYNDAVTADALRVDEDVFRHTIGKPSTYPAAADRDAILAARGGLQSLGASVGQGGGATEVGLVVGTEYGSGGALELSFSMDVEATAGGVVVGASLGASVDGSIVITSGTETRYTGSVGSIPAGEFADHPYQFGLFTYVYPDPITGQEYEVIDYWVE